VAGIATVATATASVTVIAATAQPDPIFAALAKCREKEAGWLALCDRDDVLAIVPDKPLRQQIESAQEQYQEAEGRLAEVVPPHDRSRLRGTHWLHRPRQEGRRRRLARSRDCQLGRGDYQTRAAQAAIV
jgi:hypothetical protein